MDLGGLIQTGQVCAGVRLSCRVCAKLVNVVRYDRWIFRRTCRLGKVWGGRDDMCASGRWCEHAGYGMDSISAAGKRGKYMEH